MKVELNGKNINIPDNDIANLQKSLDLTKEDAIDLWLDDNGYTEDEEQEELEKKAKNVRVDHGTDKETKKSNKPKTVKVSDEKTQIFSEIVAFLNENYDISVITNNKLVEINLNGRNFKLNLSETRQKKG